MVHSVQRSNEGFRLHATLNNEAICIQLKIGIYSLVRSVLSNFRASGYNTVCRVGL